MAPMTWRCGHERTPENSWKCGVTVSCRRCREAMWARQREATEQRYAAIVDAYRDGESIEGISARFKVSSDFVRRRLTEAGAVSATTFSADPFFPSRALKAAAQVVGASVDELVSPRRSPKALVHARWAFSYAMRQRGASTPQIGRRLKRDHSTVLYGLRQADYFAERSPEFAEMLAKVGAA